MAMERNLREGFLLSPRGIFLVWAIAKHSFDPIL